MDGICRVRKREDSRMVSRFSLEYGLPSNTWGGVELGVLLEKNYSTFSVPGIVYVLYVQ